MNETPDITRTPFMCEGLRVEPGRNLIIGETQRFAIEPRIMDVFYLLSVNAREVVTREEIISELWGVEFGGDESLTRAISQLRKTFRQAGIDKTLIETIPKRGYRLAVDVNAVTSPLPFKKNVAAPVKATPAQRRGSSKSNRGLLIAGVTSAAAAAIAAIYVFWPEPVHGRMIDAGSGRSVAVMSLADMSETQDQGYLSDGVSEEILTRLDDIPNLRVINRASSFSYKGRNVDIRDVGRELDVSHVIDGSLRRQNERMRITLQLINTSTGEQTWAKSYDTNKDDIFALQDEIANDVVTELRLVLSIGIDYVIPIDLPGPIKPGGGGVSPSTPANR